MADITDNRNVTFSLIEDLGGFVGGPELYEYDFSFHHIYLNLDVYCKNCGEHLGSVIVRGADNDVTEVGYTIDKETVCKNCGAHLYDERADNKKN